MCVSLLEWVGAAIVKKIEKKVKEAFALLQVCCTAHKPKQVRGGNLLAITTNFTFSILTNFTSYKKS